MQAFTNTQVTKTDLIAQLEAHYAADEITQGVYWEDGRGCAVGCCTHSHNHSLFPAMFGIPESIAHLMDSIFEGLHLDQAKKFPLAVIQAIPEGADLLKVENYFLEWLLVDPEYGVARLNPDPLIQSVAELHHRVCLGNTVTHEEWETARDAVKNKARAEDKTWNVAWSAAQVACSPLAVNDAAEYAYASAWNFAFAEAGVNDAEVVGKRLWTAQAQKLIELLQGAK
jgi:hypothetical protein